MRGSGVRQVEGGGVRGESTKISTFACVMVLHCNSVVFNSHVNINTIV